MAIIHPFGGKQTSKGIALWIIGFFSIWAFLQFPMHHVKPSEWQVCVWNRTNGLRLP